MTDLYYLNTYLINYYIVVISGVNHGKDRKRQSGISE